MDWGTEIFEFQKKHFTETAVITHVNHHVQSPFSCGKDMDPSMSSSSSMLPSVDWPIRMIAESSTNGSGNVGNDQFQSSLCVHVCTVVLVFDCRVPSYVVPHTKRIKQSVNWWRDCSVLKKSSNQGDLACPSTLTICSRPKILRQ